MKYWVAVLACLWALLVVAEPAENNQQQSWSQQVFAAERAFAKTMADRDFAAFSQFIADDAVFYSDSALEGKAAVLEGWRDYYQQKNPPFSWEPSRIDVTADGLLAFSSGPVKAPDGQVIGVFNSVWRQLSPGVWKVQYDKGCSHCRCQAKAQS